jgi:hypothetical protein
LNFIFGIVCLFVCVCAFSLRRESPDMILGDKPLIFEVVLSQPLYSSVLVPRNIKAPMNLPYFPVVKCLCGVEESVG